MESSVKRASPWYNVPCEPVVSIEHPCIVRNIDNGIKSSGGEVQLDRRNISISLRPGDPSAKPISSSQVKTKSLLLKVSVPKLTGRKRKRGSSGPFLDEFEVNGGTTPRDVDAELLLQCMRDNPTSYSVEPVGLITETHRFRYLPDFQYAASTDPLMENMRQSILAFDYESLKNFDINLEKGMRPAVDVGPPAVFSPLTIPFDYGYRQNPFVKFSKDDAGRLTVTHLYGRLHRTMVGTCAWNQTPVLSGPLNPLEPEAKLEKSLSKTLRELRAKVTSERPIWTRRALHNQFPRNQRDNLKLVYPYVFYSFKDGPWSNAMIPYGLDPRSDPKYRIYQTLVFKITANPDDPSNATVVKDLGGGRVRWINLPNDKTSHIFDGKRVIPDGKIWQVCDITDPLVRRLLDTDNLRTQCDAQHDGWYHNGTWAKARIFMRDKVKTMLEGGTPDDAYYEKFMSLPDIIDRSNMSAAYFSRRGNTTTHEFYLASEIRTSATGFHSTQQRTKRTRLHENKVLGHHDEAAPETPEAAAARGEGSADVIGGAADSEEDEIDATEEGPREVQQAEEEDSDVEIEEILDDALDGDGARENSTKRPKKKHGARRTAAEEDAEEDQAEQDVDDEGSGVDARYHSTADPDDELPDASGAENSVGFEDEDMDDY
ncbi:hypothetical protein W97_02167 [Coniosporium apollinis CBS 100218]|uniref:Transcription factor IIIC subunit 5 HTH domain-containing protein n=1 Tax=Coniosporium apollinis (strain CBS 100218) TaxID=1168221 RepID=R7YMQ8_CONA1|nr:uncharacterized protein W97_02167 [Coniosporium apollinis CBS 100218]EON62941.1 hypothetical protein W97_02167 [Coniosporium apollinis CBS 100218]